VKDNDSLSMARGTIDVDQFVVDPGSGLPEAINKGLAELPLEIEYINWLGDDDLLKPESISKAVTCARHVKAVSS
jgi:2-phospho-L-lactate guanylyltransferase (CobY/MobA/RfbA family)